MIDPANAYAFGAGAAGFFSPCSVGLLPAYMGYFLGTSSGPTRSGAGAWSQPAPTWRTAVARGAALGALGSAGFLALFGPLAVASHFVPLRWLDPFLAPIGIAVGLGIVVAAVALMIGFSGTVRLPGLGSAAKRAPASVFGFGFFYALASLGCTFPLFLSVILTAGASPGLADPASAILAYTAGMAFVMVPVTIALGLVGDAVHRWLKRGAAAMRWVTSGIMLAGGSTLAIYWIDAAYDLEVI